MPWTALSKRSIPRIKINGHKRTGRRNIVNIASFLSPKEEVIFLRDDMTIRQGLEKMKRYGYTAVPVIDAEREVSEAELADPEADRYGQKDGQRGILLKEFDDIGSRKHIS